MAHAPSLTRSDRAAGIVTRQECEPLENGSWRVRDTQTGSGEWHTTSSHGCTCWDYRRRGGICKHMRAIILEEQALAAYCDDWNTRASEARANFGTNLSQSDDLPGDFLDTALNFADDGLLIEVDNVHVSLRCPTCNAPLDTRSYYVGGKGYTYFTVCTRDAAHHARQA